MSTTNQEKFWEGDFGKEYTDRNDWEDDAGWDKIYLDTWGMTKLEINDKVLQEMPRDIKILEVGCNYGAQLRGFQRMGFENLYGIELQPYAVEKSKKKYQRLNIIQGSGFDLPFRDGFFDLVCTNGVLIHISPNDHSGFMKEIYRCSKKYIMGWEYYNKTIKELNYRENTGFMWKADFAKIYQVNFPGLVLKKEFLVKYISNENQDSIFLLDKQ
ncbi:MAG: methyltransferase domain-containing protein [Bacteroidetes bacterium]|nr:methyltransferase domain-containing protein [Bacteroidota bacterium]